MSENYIFFFYLFIYVALKQFFFSIGLDKDKKIVYFSYVKTNLRKFNTQNC